MGSTADERYGYGGGFLVNSCVSLETRKRNVYHHELVMLDGQSVGGYQQQMQHTLSWEVLSRPPAEKRFFKSWACWEGDSVQVFRLTAATGECLLQRVVFNSLMTDLYRKFTKF